MRNLAFLLVAAFASGAPLAVSEASAATVTVSSISALRTPSPARGATIDTTFVADRQGADMLFKLVECGRSGQPGCKPDNVVTFAHDRSAACPSAMGRCVWQRQFNGDIFLTWAGAKGDDRTNDCAAFGAAISAAQTYGVDVSGGDLTYYMPCTGFIIDVSKSNLVHAHIDNRALTAKSSGRYVITVTNRMPSSALRGVFVTPHAMRDVVFMGPDRSTNVNTVGLALVGGTKGTSYGLTFERVAAYGYANFFTAVNMSQWALTFDKVTYQHENRIAECGTFLRLQAPLGMEDTRIINSAVINCNAFIVDAARAPADIYVRGTSVDGGTYVYTGDDGRDVGSAGGRARVTFCGHLEAQNGRDYVVRTGVGGAFYFECGVLNFDPHSRQRANIAAKPWGYAGGRTGDGGITFGTVYINHFDNSVERGGRFEHAVEGPGTVYVAGRVYSAGLNYGPVFAVSNNLIPNWTFARNPLADPSVWARSAAGGITYDTNTAPPSDGVSAPGEGSIALDGTYGAQRVTYVAQCSPGKTAVASVWMKTAGLHSSGASVEIGLQYIAGDGRVLGANGIKRIGSEISGWTPFVWQQNADNGVGRGRALAPPGTVKVKFFVGLTHGPARLWLGKPQLILQ